MQQTNSWSPLALAHVPPLPPLLAGNRLLATPSLPRTGAIGHGVQLVEAAWLKARGHEQEVAAWGGRGEGREGGRGGGAGDQTLAGRAC